MATDSKKKLTTYTSAVTVVTAEVMNALYGGEYAHNLALYAEDQYHPLVSGHLHDGEHADGHASKINLTNGAHVRGALSHANLGGTEGTNTQPAVQKDNIQCYPESVTGLHGVGVAIPLYEMVDGERCYYLDLSMMIGGSDTHVQFNQNGEFGGEPHFVYDYNQNRVGIGVPSPDAKLAVGSSDNTIGVIVREVDDSHYGPDIYFDKGRLSSIVQDQDYLGTIMARGWDGDEIQASGAIQFRVDGAPIDNDVPSELRIMTRPSGVAGLNFDAHTRIIVKSDGNVGIGELAPSERLHVDGNGLFTGDLTVGNKLTVGGLIDPTGLILTEEDESGAPGVPTGPNKGAIFVSDGNGNNDVNNNPLEKNKLYYKDENDNITKLGGGGDPSPPEESVQYNWQGQFAGDSSIRIGHTSKNLGVGVTDPAEPVRRLHVKDAEGVPPVRINSLPLGQGQNVVWNRTTGDLYQQPPRTTTTPGLREFPTDGSDLTLDIRDVGEFIIIVGPWNGRARVIIPDMPEIFETFPEGWPDGIRPQPSPGPDPVSDIAPEGPSTRLGQYRTGNTYQFKNLCYLDSGSTPSIEADTFRSGETESWTTDGNTTSAMTTFSRSSDQYTYELMNASVNNISASSFAAYRSTSENPAISDLQALVYNTSSFNANYMNANLQRAAHARQYRASLIISSLPGSRSTLDGGPLFYILPPGGAVEICCIKEEMSDYEIPDDYEDVDGYRDDYRLSLGSPPHWFIKSHYHEHVASTNAPPYARIIARITDEYGEVTVVDSGSTILTGTYITFDGGWSGDPDADSLTYEWHWYADGVEGGVLNKRVWTLGTSAHAGQEITATLMVNDGNLSSDIVYWNAYIENANQAPYASVTAPSSGTVYEDLYFDGSNSFDPDGDSLTYEWSLTQQPSTSSLSLDGYVSPTISFVPVEAGVHEVSLVVNDGYIDSDAATASVDVVSASYNIPVITASNRTINQHETFVHQATAYDAEDGDLTSQITYTIYDAYGTQLTGIYTSSPGAYIVNCDVTDSNGNAATTVTITVTVVANQQPVIDLNGSSAITLDLGETYTELATASDAEDGSLTINITYFDENGVQLSGGLDTNTAQVCTIKYNVADQHGYAADEVIRTVTVTDSIPVITTGGDVTLNQYETYVSQVSASDTEDGDLTNVVSIVCTDANANVISGGAPDTSVAGVYTLTCNVADSDGNNAVEETITVTVVAADVHPVIGSFIVSGDQSVGGRVEITAPISDADGTIFTYEYSIEAASYNSTPDLSPTGAIQVNAQSTNAQAVFTGYIAGDYTIKLTVTDDDGLETFASTTLSLSPHYVVDMDSTGESQLVIFENTITTLDPGDEIGLWDANGVETLAPSGTDPVYTPTLVGAAIWTGGQTDVVGTVSVDTSAYNGPVTNGAVVGNQVIVKIWKAAEQREYTVYPTWNTGTGNFGEVLLTVSELPPVYFDWIDDPGAYYSTATIAGGVIVNHNTGTVLGDAGDLFAAFDSSGNVRGVAVQLMPTFGPYQGQVIYEMMMRSNNAGEVLTFKYYDASEDTIFDINEAYTFVINDIIGNVYTPVEFSIGPVPSGGSSGQYSMSYGSSGSMTY